MKKIFMTLAAVAVAATVNAQMYIGGNIGYNNNKSNNGAVGTPATQETTTNQFTFAPEFGMSINDKWGFGVILGVTSNKNETKMVGAAATAAAAAGQPTSTETSSTRFSIQPYARYKFIKWGKADIFVDGGLNFATTSQKDMKAEMDFGLFVSPGIAYNFNEKWSVAARLTNMFTVGYHKDAVPDVDGAPDAATSFNINAGTGNFVIGNILFGVYYNF